MKKNSSGPDVTVTGIGPTAPRVLTGLTSLDWAAADLRQKAWGIPLRSIWEIYGHPEAGKNTLAYYMAGCVQHEGHILYTALEGFDREYVASAVGRSGFKGSVVVIEHLDEDGSSRTHEAMLKEMLRRLWEPENTAAILDSVGMLRPIMEREGDFGEAFMGRRAQLVAQFCREAEGVVMEKTDRPPAVFVINHVLRQIGTRTPAGVVVWTTPGGDAPKFAAAARVFLRSKENLGGAYLSEGKFEKLRFGGKGRSFQFVILPGLGVHVGLSAVYDCLAVGLAKKDKVVELNGKSHGYMAKLIQTAGRGQDDKFEPFIAAMKGWMRKEIEI